MRGMAPVHHLDVSSPGPTIKPIAWDALTPAMAPTLSFSDVASETYDRTTAAFPVQ